VEDVLATPPETKDEAGPPDSEKSPRYHVEDITESSNDDLSSSISNLDSDYEGRRDDGKARMTGRTKDFRLAHFAIEEGNSPRPGDAVISKITKASPNFILAEDAPISIRKTRGGDATEARSKESGTTAIMVGMPTLSQLKARS